MYACHPPRTPHPPGTFFIHTYRNESDELFYYITKILFTGKKKRSSNIAWGSKQIYLLWCILLQNLINLHPLPDVIEAVYIHLFGWTARLFCIHLKILFFFFLFCNINFKIITCLGERKNKSIHSLHGLSPYNLFLIQFF